MRLSLRPALLLALAVGVHAYAAETTIQPGLWVITHQGRFNNGKVDMPLPNAQEMQALMKNLPPDVQAKMQKHMGDGGAAQMTDEGIKVCISPEQAAQNSIPTNPGGKCKVLNQKRSGNTISAKMQCDKGEMESTVTLQSDKAWTSTMKGHMQDGTQNMGMDMQASGKWVSADCGNLKPMASSANHN